MHLGPATVLKTRVFVALHWLMWASRALFTFLYQLTQLAQLKATQWNSRNLAQPGTIQLNFPLLNATLQNSTQFNTKRGGVPMSLAVLVD